MSDVLLGVIRVLLRLPPPLGLGPAAGQFVYAGMLSLMNAAKRAARPDGGARRGD